MRTDLREFPACPIGRELTESECQGAAGELEVGKFDGPIVLRTYLVDVFCGSILRIITTWSFIGMYNKLLEDAERNQIITLG